MKDLARETNLTVATVSRALSGKGQLAQKTRQKVLEAAERLGYTPDPVLSRLAAWRWGSEPQTSEGTNVAVLTDYQQDPLPDYTLRRIQGVRSQAQCLGYGVEIMHLRDFDWNVNRLTEVLKARGIRGVIVERVNHREAFAGFPWEEFAAVSCGLGEELLPIQTVTNDVFASLRLLWARGRERGYRRIGVMLEFQGKPDPYHRLLSAMKLEQEEKLPDEAVIPPLIYLNHDSAADTHRRLRAWIEEHSPDVIFSNRYILIYMRELQIEVPAEIACASYSLNAGSPKELAGSRSNLIAVGELALDLCDLALRRPPRTARTAQVLHLVEPDWVEGSTLPPCH